MHEESGDWLRRHGQPVALASELPIGRGSEIVSPRAALRLPTLCGVGLTIGGIGAVNHVLLASNGMPLFIHADRRLHHPCFPGPG